MRIGSILEDWIGQKLKIKPYLRWGCMWPCLEMNEECYKPYYRWHGRATIEDGHALLHTSCIDVFGAHMSCSCLTKQVLCDSPRKDDFELKIGWMGTYLLSLN